jgi:hypothetical protein
VSVDILLAIKINQRISVSPGGESLENLRFLQYAEKRQVTRKRRVSF